MQLCIKKNFGITKGKKALLLLWPLPQREGYAKLNKEETVPN
jgi:hypothetical protein